jgi:pimeloyl-ACP methyl ester carboxylesterase
MKGAGVEFLTTPQGRRIAHCRSPGRGPGVVFLGGFRSDMTGTKALFLETWAQARGRAFLRFDYSGHGASGGPFDDGCIGDWAEDAAAVIAARTEGPQVLVGSSMGGWIALLLARDGRVPVAGVVGIAAAPDFTERLWDGLAEAERAALRRDGRLERPSAYGAPLVFTRRLIEEAEGRLVLTRRLVLPCPLRLLQGEADADVPPSVALSLFAHAQGPDIRLTLVKGADHRFSSGPCLAMIAQAVEETAGGIDA